MGVARQFDVALAGHELRQGVAQDLGTKVVGLENLSLWSIVWVILVLALAGLVHGTLGLGFPLIATPLVALVTGIKTAVLIVAPPTLSVIIAAILLGGAFLPSLREWWRMPVWMFFGSLAGTYLFILTDAAVLTLLLGLIIFVYLGLDWLGKGESMLMRKHRHKFGAVFGFLGGVFEGSVNVAAPPLLIYFLSLGLAPAALVTALNLCFLTGKTTQLSTRLVTNDVPLSSWVSILPLCAVGLVTLVAGMRVRSRVDATTYRRWIKFALLAMAAILMVQFFALLVHE